MVPLEKGHESGADSEPRTSEEDPPDLEHDNDDNDDGNQLMSARLTVVMAGVLVALAIAVPSSAQGRAAAKARQGSDSAPKQRYRLPCSQQAAPALTRSGDDNAVRVAGRRDCNGTRWRLDRRVDGAMAGLRPQPNEASPSSTPQSDWPPRVQVGASVPRVAGGLGTMFFSAKVAMFSGDERAVKVARRADIWSPSLLAAARARADGVGAYRSARSSIVEAPGSTAAQGLFLAGNLVRWSGHGQIGSAIGSRSRRRSATRGRPRPSQWELRPQWCGVGTSCLAARRHNLKPNIAVFRIDQPHPLGCGRGRRGDDTFV